MRTIQLLEVNSILHQCDITELHTVVEAESVDVILTDPPYPREYLHCYEGLRDFAIHALKPSGHLLAMSGHAWMRDILNIMFCEDNAIRYQWTISQRVRGRNNGNLGRRICRVERGNRFCGILNRHPMFTCRCPTNLIRWVRTSDFTNGVRTSKRCACISTTSHGAATRSSAIRSSGAEQLASQPCAKSVDSSVQTSTLNRSRLPANVY